MAEENEIKKPVLRIFFDYVDTLFNEEINMGKSD